ncbi:hypothetical protein ACH5RR_023465 [Cinchona calisaya]|uniref:DUF4283 domain-containing protein n=1 Tax=Cinchona calisaya TaxID=153742 RepID=A0ABD2ZBW3_9GENT
MDDELVNMLQTFDLSPLEQNGITLGSADLGARHEVCSMSSLGKVFGDKFANSNGLHNTMKISWNYPLGLKVVELGVNVFQFFFCHENDLNRVLARRPWLFDNQFLILQRWEEGLDDNVKHFSKTHCWVQIWNLPVDWFTPTIGKK